MLPTGPRHFTRSSTRTKRQEHRAMKERKSDRRLSHRRRPDESGGRPRGNPMKIKNHVGTGTPARPVERSSTAGVLEAALRHPERSRFSGDAKDLAWTATALALACIL